MAEQARPADGARRPRAVLLARVALAAGALLAALLAVELVLRLADVRPTRLYPRRVWLVRHAGETFVDDWDIDALRAKSNTPGLAGLRGEYIAGIRFRFEYDSRFGHRRPYFDERDSVVMSINADNLRGPDVPFPKPEGTWRLAALGDSFTFGEGVPFESTFLQVAERRLAGSDFLARLAAGPDAPSPPPARVDSVNLGVSGFNATEVLIYMRVKLPKYDPDFVVYGFFLNDVFAGNAFSPELDRTYRLVHSPPQGLAAVSRLYDWLEMTRARRRLGELTRRMYRDGFTGADDPQWQQTRERLVHMAELCAERGDPFLMLLFPVLSSLGEEYPYRDIHALVHAFLDAHGIAYVDLLETYDAYDAAELQVHPTDHHPNEIAHRLAGERLAEAVVSQLGLR